MPIFTFVCPDCGAQREEIMPHAERDAAVVWCPNALCGENSTRMRWQGVEAVQVGAEPYALKGIFGDGSRKEIVHNRGKRRDV